MSMGFNQQPSVLLPGGCCTPEVATSLQHTRTTPVRSIP